MIPPRSSNIVFVRGLRVLMHVGIFPHELKKPQCIIIDAEIFLDEEKRWQKDEIEETISYDIFKNKISEICAHKHYNLIETLLEEIASSFMPDKKIKGIRLMAKKQNLSGFFKNPRSLGVEVNRWK